ncbi:hypothetical protein ACFL35_21720, partial [Candidatus Riflebacteria bacterium]
FYQWHDSEGVLHISRLMPVGIKTAKLLSEKPAPVDNVQAIYIKGIEDLDGFWTVDNLKILLKEFDKPAYSKRESKNREILKQRFEVFKNFLAGEAKSDPEAYLEKMVTTSLKISRIRYLEALAWDFLKNSIKRNRQKRGLKPKVSKYNGFEWADCVVKWLKGSHRVFFYGPTVLKADGDTWLHQVSFKKRYRLAEDMAEWTRFEFKIQNRGLRPKIVSFKEVK